MLNLNNINNPKNISNKAYNLALLKKNNFNVAEGYVLFEEDLINIKELKLPFKKVAVRSSALGEDGIKNSFAGIFKSILNEINNKDIEKNTLDIEATFDGEKWWILQSRIH